MWRPLVLGSAVVCLLACGDDTSRSANRITPAKGKSSAVVPPPTAAHKSDATPKLAGAGDPTDAPDAIGEKAVQPPVAAEAAPAEGGRAGDAPQAKRFLDRISSFFDGTRGHRLYAQVDKPLYKPGETIWIKSWDLGVRDLGGHPDAQGLMYELVSPKGAVVIRKNVRSDSGLATNDFIVPEGVPGGRYLVRVRSLDGGATTERPVIVANYEPPRVKKKLEFVRKAYGVGDTVTATIEVKRPTGEPLASLPLTAVVQLDGSELPRVQLTTNSHGNGLVRFQLPPEMARGDALLTVLVRDGGITESISKRVPIVLKKLQLSFFPEGGQLVDGLPGRVYFEAKNTIGKPADIEGRIVDDHGQAVARFTSYKNGLGRVAFVPATGRTYHAEVTQPVGVTEHYALPLAAREGCVLRHFDDPDGQEKAIRVAVRCSEAQKATVVATLREVVLDSATVDTKPGADAVLHLTPKDDALAHRQGVARITVFDAQERPVAERLVFRGRRHQLAVKVEAHKDRYTPRDQVTLSVSTTDPTGEPVPAELALSVVDDTVVSYADDKEGHLLSRLLLLPDLPGEVEEPNFYLDLTEAKGAVALDMLMGTHGWRKFEWKQVLSPIDTSSAVRGTVPPASAPDRARPGDGMVKPEELMAAPAVVEAPREADPEPDEAAGAELRGQAEEAERAPAPVAKMPAAQEPPMAGARRPEPPQLPRGDVAADPAMQAMAGQKEGKMAGKMMPMARRERRMDVAKIDAFDQRGGGGAVGRAFGGLAGEAMPADNEDMNKEDGDWALHADKPVAANQMRLAWAAVRVFPAPTYAGDFKGTRTDFRETVHWAPTVRTGKDGKATVTFYLSDAVTSFRVFAEGVGAGFAGRQEEVIASSLPFSMAVKLPNEVSARDRLSLPLTLTNERDEKATVEVHADLGEHLALVGDTTATRQIELEPKQRRTIFYDAKVTGQLGKSKVSFRASAQGLSDAFSRELAVVPVGFPRELSMAGDLAAEARHDVNLADAAEGTITASLTLYPSPVATMVSGMEGMLREPHGCFEQASSSNYPNVMVMNYLNTHEIADVALLEKSKGLLEKGYRKLGGYETKLRGYEWFGRTPGHEALTAYGLMQFADMKHVFADVDPAMIARTAKWLLSRRNGKGGFDRDSKALDSFGRASAEVTDAYITYALTEAGYTDMAAELDAQAKVATSTDDAYLMALATGSLLNTPARKAEGDAAADRLVGMQDADGGWSKASHSITRSSGSNLTVETTSLALLALIDSGGHHDAIRNGIKWMNANRSGHGGFGATQATVLSLRALTRHAETSRRTQSAGTLEVHVNGAKVAERAYEAGHRGPLSFEGLGQYLSPGTNSVVLKHTGGDALPYSVAVGFRSERPASDAGVAVKVETRLAQSTVKLGENVRLTARVTNTTQEGQPMTLTRVGLPGGLTFQTWQLEELRDKDLVGFYETGPREVVLYWRDLKPGETKEIPLDLVAVVPGTYTGAASSAYLYYSNDKKAWSGGVDVEVQP